MSFIESCSSVNNCSRIKCKGKYFCVEELLYKGPFSNVFVVSDRLHRYAMKTEQKVGNLRSVLFVIVLFVIP